MTRTIYTRLAAGLTIAAALVAVTNPAMAHDACGAPASESPDIAVQQQGMVTAVAIGSRATLIGRNHGYVLEECRPVRRDPATIDVTEEACVRDISGQVIGDVQIGGYPTIRGKSGKAVTAVAIGSRSACNINGTISSNAC
jgi:hypothetical protein